MGLHTHHFMETELEPVPVCFSDPWKRSTLPAWASHWHPSSMSMDVLCRSKASPQVVVVQVKNSTELGKISTLGKLRTWHAGCGNVPVYLVIQLSEAEKATAETLAPALRGWSRSIPRMELVLSHDRLEESVLEAVAKCTVEKAAMQETEPDALAEAQEVIAATRHLRAESGRLSATAIAQALGMPEAKLAALVGRTRQALAKTPDAAAIQSALSPFERVIRLQAVIKNPKDFLTWLNQKSRHLDEHSPMELIESGRVPIVADLVEAMLTGTSS